MRQTRLFILGILALVFVLPVLAYAPSAYAVDVLDPVCQNADPNNLPLVCQENAAGSPENPVFGPNGILTRAITVLARVVGVIAVIFIVVYGLKFAAAGGDASAAKTARQGIIYAVIGLIFALVAQGIVTFVLNKL